MWDWKWFAFISVFDGMYSQILCLNSMSSDCWQSDLDHPFFLISLWTGALALCWDFFFFFFSKGLYYSKNVHQIMKTGTPSKFNGHLFPQVWGPWCVKCLTVPTAAYYIFHILTEGCFFFPVYFTEVRRSLEKFKEQAWNYECLIVVVQGTVARSQLRRHM